MRVKDSPSSNCFSVASSAIDATLAMTVMAQEAVFAPSLVVAVMVVCPAFFAVTFPFWSTSAISAFWLVQVTVLSLALSGVIIAVRVKDSPSSSCFSVTSSATDATLAMTVMAQEAVFVPSLVVAVTVVCPAFFAVTFPFWSTSAISAFWLDQVTVLSLALSGVIVAVRVKDSPSSSCFSVTSSAIDATLAMTVIAQDAVFAPSLVVAVTVVCPAFFAVTFPFWSTSAISAFWLDQVTVLSLALSGVIVALRVKDSPSSNCFSVTSSAIPLTLTILAWTVIWQVPFFPPAEAEIVAEPGFIAFTVPSVTVTTCVLDELHVMVLSVASAGLTVACSR